MVPSLLLLSADVLERQEVRTALRRDGPELLLGSILATAGILAIVLFLARNRRADRVLLWFGLFTAGYGLRLAIQTNIFQFAAEPIPRQMWNYLIAALTYSLPLVGALFFQELFPEWHRVSRWLVRGLGGFAVAGIVVDLLLQRPESLHVLNNALVIAGFMFLMVALYRQQAARRIGPLHAGAVIFFTTALINNVTGFNRRDRPILLTVLEPVGFVCLIAGLGTGVVQRLFEREEQLIEVNKELEVARRIQSSILPREVPASRHIKLATRYLAMTAVAGDFYEFLAAGEACIGILIADVSGHGVPAALIASMVKIAISAQLPHAQDPAQVLTGMNQILCGKMQGQFVSAAYLFLDLNAGVMRYAGAGHPPLLACRGEQVEAISENGLLLGLFPHAAYTALERRLENGSRFVLYTDGIIEASNAQDEFFGEEKVIEALRQARALSADDTAELLVDRVNKWAGPRPQDDLTLIVVDIVGDA